MTVGLGMAVLNRARRIARSAEASQVDWLQWLPVQHSFLGDEADEVLFRAGNQIGKTTAALAKVHHACIGSPRFCKQRHQPPIEAWVVCTSWTQSVAIQRKLWTLARRYLRADTEFSSKHGFGTKAPTAVYRNGSIIRFKTSKQKTEDMSGATIHMVLFDEVPIEETFNEILERIKRKAGQVLLALTPVNRPAGYIQARVEAGLMVEHHTRLTAEALIPVGCTEPLQDDAGTPMDAAWIAKQERRYLGNEKEIRLHGAWAASSGEKVFDVFDPAEHVDVIDELPPGDWGLHIGFDHGTKAFKEVAILVAVERPKAPEDPFRVLVIDEYVGTMGTSNRADAMGVMAMLRRNGLAWSELNSAWGDRIHLGGSADMKANKTLQRELARLQTPPLPANSLQPPIWTVKRGQGRNQGSKLAGARWVYQVMATPGAFLIDPRCEHTIEALREWEGADDEHKDKIDALRYSLQDHVFGRPVRVKRGAQQVRI